MSHICETCGNDMTDHGDCCEAGHWPPTCCLGCSCGSFEAAHELVPVEEPEQPEAAR